jgi:hypothetical protein
MIPLYNSYHDAYSLRKYLVLRLSSDPPAFPTVHHTCHLVQWSKSGSRRGGSDLETELHPHILLDLPFTSFLPAFHLSLIYLTSVLSYSLSVSSEHRYIVLQRLDAGFVRQFPNLALSKGRCRLATSKGQSKHRSTTFCVCFSILVFHSRQ